MNIIEFMELYKQNNRNLFLSDEEIKKMRTDFHHIRRERYEKTGKLLDLIFESKSSTFKSLNDKEKYDVVVISKKDTYQVEVYVTSTCLLHNVNAGFGDEFYTKQQKDDLIQFLNRFCHISSVTEQASNSVPLQFEFNIRNKLWKVRTSKLRFESFSISQLLSFLNARTLTYLDFEKFVKNHIDKTKRKAMNFFDLSLDKEKMFLFCSNHYFVSNDGGRLLGFLDSHLEDTGIYTGMAEYFDEEMGLHCEYK